jgi:hypothetical protein
MTQITRIIVAFCLFASGALAQTDKPPIELFKKEGPQLQEAVEEAVSSVVPGPAGLTGHPKATYLDGYGVVVLAEVMLEASRNPFSSPKTPKEVQAIVAQRMKLVQEKLQAVLKDRVGKMQSMSDTDSLAIALLLFNVNPADVPELPSQLILTIKKRDPTQVAVRQF